LESVLIQLEQVLVRLNQVLFHLELDRFRLASALLPRTQGQFLSSPVLVVER